jgi:hypothetical protein
MNQLEVSKELGELGTDLKAFASSRFAAISHIFFGGCHGMKGRSDTREAAITTNGGRFE